MVGGTRATPDSGSEGTGGGGCFALLSPPPPRPSRPKKKSKRSVPRLCKKARLTKPCRPAPPRFPRPRGGGSGGAGLEPHPSKQKNNNRGVTLSHLSPPPLAAMGFPTTLVAALGGEPSQACVPAPASAPPPAPRGVACWHAATTPAAQRAPRRPPPPPPCRATLACAPRGRGYAAPCLGEKKERKPCHLTRSSPFFPFPHQAICSPTTTQR